MSRQNTYVFCYYWDMNVNTNLDYSRFLWRAGRKVGRTIYAQIGDDPSDSDPLIGVMDTIELAAEAVRSHNLSIPQLK
jgi:hypothetical protein